MRHFLWKFLMKMNEKGCPHYDAGSLFKTIFSYKN